MKFNRYIPAAAAILLAACTPNQINEVQKDGFTVIQQTKGPELGYSPESGVTILNVNGLAFKDLNRNGELDVYEDWRKTPEERTADLASQMSIEQIAGLMLYSDHQSVPATYMGFYDGKLFEDSDANPYDLTDEQKVFLKKDNLRAILVTSVTNAEVAAKWNNNVQAYVESFGLGIPANNSSDPRHQASSAMEYEAGGGGAISRWPSSIGMAATFDPDLMEEFGEIASREYRALGIATALSPQVDLATEPRWNRFSGTYGEEPKLAADMARSYCDGFQTSPKDKCISGAWGYESVNAMVKHWYGYGAQEAGRDSHFAFGEYAVFPGGRLDLQKIPFTEGAFKLRKGTGMASAVMPIYSILWNQDPEGTNFGGSYSDFVINRSLRQEAGFEGVVCTDWHITYNNTAMDPSGHGKPWGVEDLTVSERHYQILKAGVDQFGGNNDSGPVIDAYHMWARDFGEDAARERFEQSARRLLLNVFRVGLFENPYLDPVESSAIVGCPEYMEAGYNAQLKSVVMLKNSGVLPAARQKVYIPKRHNPAIPGTYGGISDDNWTYPIELELAGRYYDVVSDPKEADFAIVSIQEPSTTAGWTLEDVAAGGTGYVPISLQYEDYTATEAREVSIAGGNPLENFTNRTYKGKTAKVYNHDDLVVVQQTRKAMGTKPVVVIVKAGRPVVLSEIEPLADAVLISFGVQNQAMLDIISGKAEPSGLLPMQFPASMAAVEHQLEDLPRDMECYVDAAGNTYDFAFGLNWSGVINDARVEKYR